MKPSSVLFVCLGNICRSPTAEGLFRAKLAAQQLTDAITTDSAGIGAWHIGKPPDARAQRAAAARQIDISGLRARQVEAEDFEHFDYVIAMDRDNRRELMRLAGERHASKVHLMLEFAALSELEEVPDPYYGGDQGFDQVLDLIETASSGLLDHMLAAGRD